MQETTSLIKEHDGGDSPEQLVVLDQDSVLDAFNVPERNWNRIVETYNTSNRKKFFLSAMECKVIIEHVKKGIPPMYVLQAVGLSAQAYKRHKSKFNEIEDRLSELMAKPELSDVEYEEFHLMMRHPLRILITDLNRAEGICNLGDWERFNEMAYGATDLQAMKMKAKFKDFFGEKQEEGRSMNVSINIGSDFIADL